MQISRKEMQHVASLARLDLAEEEQELLATELASILEHMEKLSELDTTDIEPLAHVIDVVNAFREDRIVNEPRTDDLLANAPARDDDFISVPKIIE